MRAAWSSVPCPNTAQETKGKESSAAIHAGTVHTQSTWKRLFWKFCKSFPNQSSQRNYRIQTQPGWPAPGILMVSITSRFTRTSLLFSLQPAFREACVMLSGMRQEQEWFCGRDYLMIKSWFPTDSHAGTCMTLPFPAAEESIASSSP